MNTAYCSGVSVVGIEGRPVRIEVAFLSGLPCFQIVGLPDTALSESKERIRAAFNSCGITFPNKRVIVNLSPADTPKAGSGFDLPIAAAILSAIAGKKLNPDVWYMGELGLDGSIRSVRGILPAALGGIKCGAEKFVVPYSCAQEARVTQLDVREVWHLSQIAQDLDLPCLDIPPVPELERDRSESRAYETDLADVRGQDEARFALEIAGAGGHHLLMTGAPGVGKSMLASCLPKILPPLDEAQAVEVAAVLSALGDFKGQLPLTPPFVAPHHTASSIALVGGGNPIRPGAISRAHNGVLFLDELPEFSAQTIQALRQPMESGAIEIHRAKMSLTFPANFQLIGAANPCQCGNFLESPRRCTCSVSHRRSYYRKIGGPIFDRFDMNVILRRPRRSELASSVQAESSHSVAQRVLDARERQRARLADTPFTSNAQMSGQYVRKHTSVPKDIAVLFDRALARGEMTLRGIDKALRLAWTISDLVGRQKPESGDFHQALLFRPRPITVE